MLAAKQLDEKITVHMPNLLSRLGGRRPTVVLGADERTLIMMFIGSPHADSGQLPARVLEAGGAVALAFRERLKPHRTGWYTAQGVLREVTAVLDRPLGNRVLLDISGAPVIVTPEHLMTGPGWATRAQRARRRHAPMITSPRTVVGLTATRASEATAQLRQLSDDLGAVILSDGGGCIAKSVHDANPICLCGQLTHFVCRSPPEILGFITRP
jgi:hypothetical protein